MKYIRRMFTADGKTMDDYFDAVYLSYQLCELKPSEAIFRKMIAADGMLPAQTLFIDDGQRNVDAPHSPSGSRYTCPARRRISATYSKISTAMKKAYKIALIVTAVLIVLVLALAVAVSP